MGFEVETQIPDCSYWVQWTLHPHRKPSHKQNMTMQHHGYHSWTSHWVLQCWHPVWQSQSLYQSSIQFTYNSTQWHSKLVFSLHLITLHQPCFSSTLQPSTHIHPCYDHLTDRTRRISNLLASVKSIPYQALLDIHCTYLTWKPGTTLGGSSSEGNSLGHHSSSDP